MTEQRVVGKIASLGSMDGALFGREGWDFSVCLQPWRFDGEAPSDTSLALTVEGLARAQADRMRVMFDTGTVITATVRNLLEDKRAGWSASLTKMGSEIDDVEIANFVPPEQSQFVHRRLGTFSRNRQIGWYERDVQWNGSPIKLRLDCALEDAEAAASHAASLLDEQRSWQADCKDRAYANLFPTWQKSWADEDRQLSSHDWQERLQVTSLTVTSDGQFCFWLDDGGLFDGHAIGVRGSMSKGAEAAEIGG